MTGRLLFSLAPTPKLKHQAVVITDACGQRDVPLWEQIFMAKSAAGAKTSISYLL